MTLVQQAANLEVSREKRGKFVNIFMYLGVHVNMCSVPEFGQLLLSSCIYFPTVNKNEMILYAVLI